MIKSLKMEKVNEEDLVAYFDVSGSKLYENIKIRIRGDIAKINPMDCNCPFGSNYSQTTTNKEQKKICKHLRSCVDLLIYLKYITNWSYEE